MIRTPKLSGKVLAAAAGGAFMLSAGIAHYFEGRRYETYFDIARVATICDGHTGSDVKAGMKADDAVCDALLEKDLTAAFETEAKYLDHPEQLPPYTRGAAASFILNEGPEAFRTSTFRRLLNEGKIDEACNSLLWWNKARVGGGRLVPVQGLINRREAERHLCLGEPW